MYFVVRSVVGKAIPTERNPKIIESSPHVVSLTLELPRIEMTVVVGSERVKDRSVFLKGNRMTFRLMTCYFGSLCLHGPVPSFT